MKGFLLFLLLCLGIIAGFIAYKVSHPSDTQVVRSGAHWVVRPLERPKGTREPNPSSSRSQ